MSANSPTAVRVIAGVLPLLFAAAAFWTYVEDGTEWDVLWVCNVCNIGLGLGLLAGLPTCTWICALWVIIGTPVWALDALDAGQVEAHAFLTHIGAAAVGVWALRAVPHPRTIWPWGIALLAVLHVASRLLTPPALNINMAHDIYPPVRDLFATHWQYQLANAALFSALLAGCEWAAKRLLRHGRPGSAPRQR